MARTITFAALLLSTLAAACESDNDWLAANGGRPDFRPTQFGPIAECGGLNDRHWLKLDSAPPNAEVYLQHARVVGWETEVQRDAWYTRKPGEVLLCRDQAFWRFREKDGQVVVAESYAWEYVVVN
jgi:hypothetical protein